MQSAVIIALVRGVGGLGRAHAAWPILGGGGWVCVCVFPEVLAILNKVISTLSE